MVGRLESYNSKRSNFRLKGCGDSCICFVNNKTSPSTKLKYAVKKIVVKLVASSKFLSLVLMNKRAWSNARS